MIVNTIYVFDVVKCYVLYYAPRLVDMELFFGVQ